MEHKEIIHIVSAILIASFVAAFSSILSQNWSVVGTMILFSAIIILLSVFSKKAMANALDADVEHEIWLWSWFGFKPSQHTRKPIPMGVILPVVASAITMGALKVLTVLTYEAKALKRRAAKRFGYYSFTEITDRHTSMIGAAGITVTLLISLVSYFIPISNADTLAKLAAYYAFFNMIPISKLDGAQIFSGSRVIWTVLAIITLIFSAYAISF